jgi:hypothetical protein
VAWSVSFGSFGSGTSNGAPTTDQTGPTVTVTPSSGLTDGEAVSVTVSTVPDAPVYRTEARLCRGGVTYQPSSGNRPAQDFELGGPNCPESDKPLSTSGDNAVVDALPLDPANGGQSSDTFLYRIGAGNTSWTDFTTNNSVSLTCDDQNPCDLVMELLVGSPTGPPGWKPFTQTVTYGNGDPLAGCGGAATDALQSGGSDRMQEAWVAWSIAECQLPGRHGAASRASFVGEGPAMTAYSNNALDIAYTAAGYDKDVGFTTPDVTQRPSVAVPVALNAAVMAVGGGRRVDAFHKVPFKDIKLTSSEIATLLSGGPSAVTPLLPEIDARNSELASTEFFDTAAGILVGAYADGEASSWYATRWLDQTAPDAWKVPDLATFGADRGRARGISNSLALADPSFVNSLSLLSGRPALRKGLIGPGPNTSGGIWVLTDLQTASALNLTPVQIQDGKGNYIAPTAATLQADVPLMKQDDQGISISDPTATSDTPAYPLTFVEYALVPLAPLQNDDCSMRTDAQTLLQSWLHYVVGDGQKALPSGMAPLTPDLLTQANAAIAKVGTAPAAITCPNQAQQPVTPPADNTGGLNGGGPSSFNSSIPLSSSFKTSTYAPPANTPVGAATPAATNPAAVEQPPAVPAYTGTSSSSSLGTLLALVGIIALVSCVAFATAGRSSPGP